MSNPSFLNDTTVMPLIPPIPSVPQVPPPIPSIPSIPGGPPRVPGIPMFPIANNSLIDPTKDLPLPPKNKNIKKYQWSPIKANTYKGSFWKEMQEKQDKEKVKIWLIMYLFKTFQKMVKWESLISFLMK